MALKSNNAEGQSNGTTLTTGNSGGTSGDAFDLLTTTGTSPLMFSNEQAMHGTMSYKFSNVSGGATDLCNAQYNGGTTLSASMHFYFLMLGRPTGAIQIASLRNNSNGAWAMNLANSSGQYRFQLIDTAGSAYRNMATPITSGVWHRIEVTVTAATSTTGSATVSVYLGDATTELETYTTTTSNFGTANLTQARFGKITASSSVATMYYDDVAVNWTSTSFIGGASPIATSAWMRG